MGSRARLAVLVGLALSAGRTAAAASIAVTTTADELGTGAACSLREAIRAANTDAAFGGCDAGAGADTIVLSAGTYTLVRAGADEDDTATGDLDVHTGDLTVTGAGNPVIDGNGATTGDRVFEVRGAVALALVGVRVLNGRIPTAPGGGVLTATGSTLSLVDVEISGCTADVGAGVASNGTLDLVRVTVDGNTATSEGGGVDVMAGGGTITDSTITANAAGTGGGIGANAPLVLNRTLVAANTADVGGGIANNTTLTLRNVTLSGNRARGNGGGLHNLFTHIDFRNVTIAANVADDDGDGTGDGGGIYNFGDLVPTLDLRNTLVGDNVDRGGEAPDCYGYVNSMGHNLIESTTGCSPSAGTGDVTGMDAALGALADNGGVTRTHALGSGSPAIEAGDPGTPGTGGNACEATDQRQATRPVDTVCDVGAFEFGGAPPPTTTTTSSSTTTSTSTSLTTTTSTSTSVTTTSTSSSTSTTAPPETTTTTTTSLPPPLVCSGGTTINHSVLRLRGLGGRGGDEGFLLKARLAFGPGMPPGFDPAGRGMQILIEDLGAGAASVWELSAHTGTPVPPGPPGSGCGPADGWKRGRYTNRSDAVAPPACPAGSANGLKLIELTDRRARGGGIGIVVKASGATIAPPVGPLGIALVLDAAPEASSSGACAYRAYLGTRCGHRARRAVLECR